MIPALNPKYNLLKQSVERLNKVAQSGNGSPSQCYVNMLADHTKSVMQSTRDVLSEIESVVKNKDYFESLSRKS